MPRKPTTGEHGGTLATGVSSNAGGGVPAGFLTSVTASLQDSQGPCFVTAEIRLEGKAEKSIAFADAEWIRSGADGPIDVFNYQGRVAIPEGGGALRLIIANDTGSSVDWRTSWTVEHE